MSTNTIHMIPTRLFIMSLWRHVRLISPILRGLPIPQSCLASATRLSLFPSCNTGKNAYVRRIYRGWTGAPRARICITIPAWYFRGRTTDSRTGPSVFWKIYRVIHRDERVATIAKHALPHLGSQGWSSFRIIIIFCIIFLGTRGLEKTQKTWRNFRCNQFFMVGYNIHSWNGGID